MDLQILAKFHVLRVERHDTCSLNRGLDGRVSANFDCVLCSSDCHLCLTVIPPICVNEEIEIAHVT